MTEESNRDDKGRFLAGNSGGGRKPGSRNKFTETLLSDFIADWESEDGGQAVIQKVRLTDPSTYLRLAFSVLPKDYFVSVQQELPGSLSPDDWALLRELMGVVRQANAQALPPGEAFEIMAQALRFETAKLVSA